MMSQIRRRALAVWRARRRLVPFLTARIALRVGDVAARLGRWDIAERIYRSAIEHEPLVPSWRVRHGHALRHTRRSHAGYAPALPGPGPGAATDRAAAALSWLVTAELHERAEEWAHVVEATAKAAALTPDDPAVFERLGLAHDHLRQYRPARHAFARALELDPDTSEVDRALLAVKPNFFTFRRDQARFVASHLDEIRGLAERRQQEASDVGARPRIFVYWGQGFDAAPDIVERCRVELRRWHDAADLVELDDTTVPDWVDIPDHVARVRERHRAHYSDYLRCALLARHGGVWVDATLLTTGSILDRLPQMLPSGFFVFRFSPNSPSISNWFMAARPGGAMIATMLAALDVYWRQHDRPVHYFFFHHVFEALVHLDASFAAGWERTWRHPDEHPHALLACMYDPYDPARVEAALRGSFVHKLAHKPKGDRFPPERMLEVLTDHPATPWVADRGPVLVHGSPARV